MPDLPHGRWVTAEASPLTSEKTKAGVAAASLNSREKLSLSLYPSPCPSLSACRRRHHLPRPKHEMSPYHASSTSYPTHRSWSVGSMTSRGMHHSPRHHQMKPDSPHRPRPRWTSRISVYFPESLPRRTHLLTPTSGSPSLASLSSPSSNPARHWAVSADPSAQTRVVHPGHRRWVDGAIPCPAPRRNS